MNKKAFRIIYPEKRYFSWIGYHRTNKAPANHEVEKIEPKEIQIRKQFPVPF